MIDSANEYKINIHIHIYKAENEKRLFCRNFLANTPISVVLLELYNMMGSCHSDKNLAAWIKIEDCPNIKFGTTYQGWGLISEQINSTRKLIDVAHDGSEFLVERFIYGKWTFRKQKKLPPLPGKCNNEQNTKLTKELLEKQRIELQQQKELFQNSKHLSLDEQRIFLLKQQIKEQEIQTQTYQYQNQKILKIFKKKHRELKKINHTQKEIIEELTKEQQRLENIIKEYDESWNPTENTTTEKLSLLQKKHQNCLNRITEILLLKANEKNLCIVCLENEKDAACVPCGHTFCLLCIQKIKNCATCRKPIENSLKIFV